MNRVQRRAHAPLRAAFAWLGSVWCAAAVLPAGAQQPSPTAPPPASQPVVERYDYHIVLPDTGTRIAVEALVQLREPPATDTVAFDLDDAMQVSSVTFACAARPVLASFTHAVGRLRVAQAPGAVDRGAMRCILVSYAGTPSDGLIIRTDSAGRWEAFGDNFPNRARHWLASMDHPSRKAKVTFRVSAPAGRTVVANGALISTQPQGDGRALTTWREDRPLPSYDMVIAAAPLVMTDLGRTACGLAEDGGCVPQMVYTAPEQARYMPGAFARAGDIVAFYARTVGPYPYEKLAHLQSTTRYGGMENASAIFYYDRAFRRPNGVDDGLIAHETAHQWFGNSVTEREWAHVWLSEGFATFLAALWAQHAHGDSAYAADMRHNREAVLKSTSAATRAVIDSVETDPNRLLNENSYQKGGLVLHMLRLELGDSTFFAGLRRYYAAHRHANALTQDLQRAFEEVSGQPLGWFFDQWLRRPGWAEVRTAWAVDGATGRVRLLVDQDGRFGAYRISLPIDVVDAEGHHTRLVVKVDAVPHASIELPERVQSPASVGCDRGTILLMVCSAK